MTSSPTSDAEAASAASHEHNKVDIVDDEARVRESFESLPGTEHQVDFGDVGKRVQGQTAFNLPPSQFANLPDYRELRVEITVTTPDGRRILVEESQEYELDEDGTVKNYEFEDAGEIFTRVFETMALRLE